MAVMEQAQQGRVRSIEAQWDQLAPAVARSVVPGAAGRGLFATRALSCVQLNGTWGATFGEAALCSVVLCRLHLRSSGLCMRPRCPS